MFLMRKQGKKIISELSSKPHFIWTPEKKQRNICLLPQQDDNNFEQEVTDSPTRHQTKYSRLSLSRPRLSRITAYLEEKI